jgi:hypothetical protein
MDGSRFDDLVKSFGRARSRRSMLGALAGAALAAAGLGQAEATGRKRSVGNACATNSDCASNLCVQETRTRKICHCRSAGDCPAVSGQCQTGACLPSGYCGASVNAGADCDDPNPCHENGVCQADGSCLGAPIDCDDNNACTNDVCDAATGCVHVTIDCDDNNLCTVDSCDRALGCLHTPVVCDDGDACTVKSCDPATGCVFTPKDCDDGNLCTTDSCDPATGLCLNIPVTCPSRGACYNAGACDSVTGCVYTESAPGTVCSEGDENCIGGVCCASASLCGTAPNQTCCAEGTHCASGVCVINSGGGGCVAAGARVTLADGSTKPIETLRVGDLVRGRGGAVNAVLALQTPLLGDRPLHALNGGAHFVTASHPFQTTDGPKSIDPDATFRETGKRVGRLLPGDVMLGEWTARNGDEPGLDGHPLVTLEAIAAQAFDWGTQLYNLIVSGDGSHLIEGALMETKLF